MGRYVFNRRNHCRDFGFWRHCRNSDGYGKDPFCYIHCFISYLVAFGKGESLTIFYWKGGVMRKLLVVVMSCAVLTYLTGCETTKGAGKDIENTGKNIQETVDKNQ